MPCEKNLSSLTKMLRCQVTTPGRAALTACAVPRLRRIIRLWPCVRPCPSTLGDTIDPLHISWPRFSVVTPLKLVCVHGTGRRWDGVLISMRTTFRQLDFNQPLIPRKPAHRKSLHGPHQLMFAELNFTRVPVLFHKLSLFHQLEPVLLCLSLRHPDVCQKCVWMCVHTYTRGQIRSSTIFHS
jgi:hypothetical protein